MEKGLNLANLQALINLRKRNDAEKINNVLSILAQVSLAVLIIFVMIAILFSSKYKNQAEYWRYRSEQFARTPECQTLVDLQRQKLILAFERIIHEYRLQLGHYTFFMTTENEGRVVNIENIISGRNILSGFVSACKFAHSELRHPEQFYTNFIREVLRNAELADDGIEVTPEVLDEQNRAWFRDQARAATTMIYNDTINMQENAKEALAKYYQDHITDINILQEEADHLIMDLKTTTSESAREALINAFLVRVKVFVEDELTNQNVPVLQSMNNM